MKKLIFYLIFLTLMPAFLFSQDFGKNKVQYKDFDWYFIQTDHFDIYFSQGGEYIADFTASVAEASLSRMSKEFRYQINNRVPIVIYNSHNDFQQTNVVQEYMEEGVGGVTELFKNRVVVPFEGNYKQFRHVIAHELVHAFLNDMFYGGSLQSIISNNISLQIPLWMNEGLAEYMSLEGWDTNSDIFLRDATISEYLPPINYLYGYFAYRGGQSVWWYISEKYGKEKVGDLLQRIKAVRSVDQGIKSALGLNMEELSERWQREQKVLYWPDIAKREDPTMFSKRLTEHKKDNNFYNTSPSMSPKGDKIAFISDRNDYFDVYIMSATDGKIIDKVVSGQRTKDFEELHLLTPGITWSPDGNKIALAVKSGERDAIFIENIVTGDEQKIQFDLEGIFSVNWSPIENKLTFVGNTSIQSDIYIYDMDKKTLTNMTNDIFSDSDPVFSPDGKTVYFSSDRGNYLDKKNISGNFRMYNHNFNQYDIYSLDLTNNSIKRITDSRLSDETSVVVAPDGEKILFISDKNGINNIYEKNLETGIERPITNSLNGIYQLSLSKDGSKLVYSSLIYAGFDLFLMKNPFDRDLKKSELEPSEFIKRRDQQILLAANPKLKSKSETPADTSLVKINKIERDSILKVKEKDTTSNLYGENIRIDFQNFIFTEKYDRDSLLANKTNNPLPNISGKDSLGRYYVSKYKINFSPDLIYGNAGYSTFYGVQGTTQMAFSDMLGNHQIFFATNLLLDLKNSDYVLAYYYLPKKIDWGIIGYHSARFLYLGNDYYSSLYRFRNYGLTAIASLPFDRFNRTDFTLGWVNLSQENLDDPSVPNQSYSLIYPSISYVHDNTLWGMTAPNNGTRYNLTFSGSPPISNNSLSFYTFTYDYRKYFKLTQDYNFVSRVSGGISFGKNPGQFFIGGTENWINRQFENNTIPINNVQDFAFLAPGLPLRGYNYDAQRGTRFSILNLEMRFPLIKYFLAGPIPLLFQNILGTAFIDVGSAWFKESDLRFFEKDADGNTKTRDLLIGMGFGARVFLFYFPLKFDIAWPYDFRSFGQSKFYISIGADF
jgi:Tol biopolymer transport system component